MKPLECHMQFVSETIAHLHLGGQQGCETAVLWLANYDSQRRVAEVYRPDQSVAEDYFHISRAAMRQLMNHLRTRRMMVVAQVHSHPGRAFHSVADDRWALVRHEGALSLVLPDFAAKACVENFISQSAIYRLSPANEWERVQGHSIPTELRLVGC